ncbi:hypothetical protein AKJ09_01875 [Labilithrix luteola]|uniref:Outer membrane lipoprotein BamD-like domain-containing protein n=1 Tax=Labilithrix luteola TaxID=1391654 RepID=A0A0K1PPA0_9BACT|nr:hypothetical protein [Labilithrix luteola]AKU95211.1 hypothetical protein AKJ09_01875 [Labilithrix luteola]
MSRHDMDLDALIRRARAERPPRRWQRQRALFRRLAFGGAAALLLTRLSYALSPLFRSPRLTLGVVGLVAAATTVASVSAMKTTSLPTSEGKPVASEAAPTAVSTVSPSANELPAEPTVPTISIEALPSARVAVLPARSSAANSTSAEEDQLAKEAASLSRIRSRLAARDFSGARADVQKHREVFARGHLGQEVNVLEIEAYQGLGQEAQACELGRSFLDAHPTSAHQARVAGLMRSCPR